jgi:hypothetical protein
LCLEPGCDFIASFNGDNVGCFEHEHQETDFAFTPTVLKMFEKLIGSKNRRDAISAFIKTLVLPKENAVDAHPDFKWFRLQELVWRLNLEPGVYARKREPRHPGKEPPQHHQFKECMIHRFELYDFTVSTPPASHPCPDCWDVDEDKFRRFLFFMFHTMLQPATNAKRGKQEPWKRYQMRRLSDLAALESEIGKRNNRGAKELPLPPDFLTVINADRRERSKPPLNLLELTARKHHYLSLYEFLKS